MKSSAETTNGDTTRAREMTRRLVSDLKPHPRNSKTHSQEQIEYIASLIDEFGFTRPLLIDASDQIIAGEGAWKAAKLAGLEEVTTIVLDDLSPEQLRAYLIADNRAAEYGADWNAEILLEEFDELEDLGIDLDLTGFDEVERSRFGGHTKSKRKRRPDVDPDDVPQPHRVVVTRPDDVWQLGPHRLACGDSLTDHTKRLLLEGAPEVSMIATDPPYAIYGSATGIASDITDDKMVVPFFRAIFKLAEEVLPWFGHCYLFCDWRSWAALWHAGKETPNMEPKNMIVWDKEGSGLGNNYANTHELIAFWSKLPEQNVMGQRRSGQRPVHRPNVIHQSRVTGKEREHNAAKPVALMRQLIENSSERGDTVLEPFCGSGSTLIAADECGRICLAADIEPKWCDVTMLRYQRITGEMPRLISSADGLVAHAFDVVGAKRAESNG